MRKKRRRVKQTAPLEERINALAQDLREQALTTPPGEALDEILRRLEAVEGGLDMVEFLAARPNKC